MTAPGEKFSGGGFAFLHLPDVGVRGGNGHCAGSQSGDHILFILDQAPRRSRAGGCLRHPGDDLGHQPGQDLYQVGAAGAELLDAEHGFESSRKKRWMPTSPSSRARRVSAAFVEMTPSATVLPAIKSAATSLEASPSIISRWTNTSLPQSCTWAVSCDTVRILPYSKRSRPRRFAGALKLLVVLYGGYDRLIAQDLQQTFCSQSSSPLPGQTTQNQGISAGWPVSPGTFDLFLVYHTGS